MKESERISYLVDTLEGGNAKRFAEKTGICQQSVSCLRHGKYGIGRFVKKIADAYPDVNITWLQTGEGYPLVSVSEKSIILSKIENLEKEVHRLSVLLNRLSEAENTGILPKKYQK